jgi:predicted nucleotide-binding protein (sugar kinase/HSP70/actin superfamily)
MSMKNVGKIRVCGKKVLIPEMNRMAASLFAATFRSFGIDAQVLPTYRGMDLGRKFTSGKECYPCQVTLGDILRFAEEEKKRLGEAFRSENYIYFLPESEGPCRFGLYNKYQRIVLDSFPEFRNMQISALTTRDGYSVAGLLEEGNLLRFRKGGYLSLVVADILDRLCWRVRPYEKEPGMTDAFMDQSLNLLAGTFEEHGSRNPTAPVLERLTHILEEGRRIIDPRTPPKPRIGIVGEIFLRMHRDSNQDLIRTLEACGAEVVNASLCEWVNYVSYEALRQAGKKLMLSLRLLRLPRCRDFAKKALGFGLTFLYQERVQRAVYRRAKKILDVPDDPRISLLEKTLLREGVYSFDVPTEACLSVAGILHFAKEGYNGVVNVYPFTCMPGTTTSAIVRPLIREWRFPYLDVPCDGSSQPNREAAVRTFMYQARQHFLRHENGNGGGPR